jgi:uncharacterized membrane protein YgaE (UPF0421/DUF939 family)
MGLGSVDTWTLAEAREQARLQRQLLDEGKDPIEARTEQQQAEALEKAKAVAFQDCAKEYIKAHKASWKSAKHADQWTSTLETWARPLRSGAPAWSETRQGRQRKTTSSCRI